MDSIFRCLVVRLFENSKHLHVVMFRGIWCAFIMSPFSPYTFFLRFESLLMFFTHHYASAMHAMHANILFEIKIWKAFSARFFLLFSRFSPFFLLYIFPFVQSMPEMINTEITCDDKRLMEIFCTYIFWSGSVLDQPPNTHTVDALYLKSTSDNWWRAGGRWSVNHKFGKRFYVLLIATKLSSPAAQTNQLHVELPSQMNLTHEFFCEEKTTRHSLNVSF